MCDRQDRDSPVPSQNETASVMFAIDAFEAKLQVDEPLDDREEIWNRRLRSLEEWVCVLLIKNQELRMSLRNDTANNNVWRPSEGDIYGSPP